MRATPQFLMSMDTRRALVALLASSILALLTACSPHSLDDLTTYVEEIQARPGAPIEPLAIDRNFSQVPEWSRDGRRDPFRPFATNKSATGPLPPLDPRATEELEAFPLDSLRMVGVVWRSGWRWRLVRAPDGIIHQVRPGNYMGQNHGKVIEVGESRIELAEIVPGAGEWQERRAAIALYEGS